MSTRKTVYLFTAYGLGRTDHPELKLKLAQKCLALLAETRPLPAQICFYTDGVRLCVPGSPVLAELRRLEQLGVELVLCSTCLETFGLRDQVAVGVVGGMGDILAALTSADQTISV